ncbi:MAG: hypothetical protein KF724_12150 [Phycisphaeraceae bacterium]|nr:hypothetical protein [Phycisphaeraceae bacterium]
MIVSVQPNIVVKQSPAALDVLIEYPALPEGGERPRIVQSIGRLALAKATRTSVLGVEAEIPPEVAGDIAVDSVTLVVAHPGDLNLDGTVDAADLGMLLGDPAVDGASIGTLLGAWGKSKPPTTVARSPLVPRMGSTGGGKFKLSVTGSNPVLADADDWVFLTHRITLPPNTPAKVRWLLPLT